MAITEVISNPASRWQNPYVERLIGSIRRDCLNQLIILNEAHLHRTLTVYLRYYHRARTHLGLNKDAPYSRPVSPPSTGTIVGFTEVGGLHHRYEVAPHKRAPFTVPAGQLPLARSMNLRSRGPNVIEDRNRQRFHVFLMNTGVDDAATSWFVVVMR
jgi:hypothetical protein